MAHPKETMVTGICTLSFPHLKKPYAFEGNDPKFQANFLFDPDSETAKKIVKLSKKLIARTWPGKKPGKVTSAIRDGNEKDFEGFEGKSYIVAKSPEDSRPVLLNEERDEEMDISRFYPGCQVKAAISLYINPKFPRVCVSLNGVQFVRDGDRIGGFNKEAVKELFSPVETADMEMDDDDMLN
jgi:hypothetical protein